MTLITSSPNLFIPTDISLTQFIFTQSNPFNPCLKNYSLPAFIDNITHETLTHYQVKEQAKLISSGLINKLNLKQGDVVMVHSPNNINYPGVFLGALDVGVVITTANPIYTASELHHQLIHSKSKVIITSPVCLEAALEANSKLSTPLPLYLLSTNSASSTPTLLDIYSRTPYEFLNVQSNLNLPAFITYSSGTTGLPKGVILTHHNLIANLIQSSYGKRGFISTGSVVLGVLPYFHCYGMMSVVLTSIFNHLTVISTANFNFTKFLEDIQHHKISHLFIVPPMILGLAKSPEVKDYDLSSIRIVMSGAGPLPVETAKLAKQRLGVDVLQGYGMSELTPITSILPHNDTNVASVGKLVPNLQVKIVNLDTNLPVNYGDIGELRVKGPNVMLGYLNDSKATSDTIDEEGFLKTGDICYVDKDHYLYVVDRAKELIKYKGFQVAPAELENLVLSHPQVQDACVIGVPCPRAGELPKAFIVLSPDSDSEQIFNELRKLSHEKLAPYKAFRGGIEAVNEIPKSKTGKVLRRVLKQMEIEKIKNAKI